MKKSILSLFLIFFPFLLMGQMFPLSEQYLYDALQINPAFAGSHDALSTSIMYRNQWTGFKDAPKNYFLSVHAPLNNDRLGLGFIVEKNTIGIYNETSFIGNYAYRMRLRNGRLALGLGFGFTVYNIAYNELLATDPNDNQLIDVNAKSFVPEFSLGGYYYNKQFYLGLSLPLFLGHGQEKTANGYKTSSNFSGSNFYLNTGYNFQINRQVKFLPSVLVKYHKGNDIQVDINALTELKEMITLGIAYRTNNSLIGILQCQLNYQFKLGYSYDYYFGTISRYMNGSHEIFLNYKFRYRRKVIGPRHF